MGGKSILSICILHIDEASESPSKQLNCKLVSRKRHIFFDIGELISLL